MRRRSLLLRPLLRALALLVCADCRRRGAAAHGGAHDGDSVAGSWPCFGQNTQRQAAATGAAAWNRALWANASLDASLDLGGVVEAFGRFHYHAGAPIRASPVLGKNSHHVYVIDAGGVLHAVHASDDTEHWNVTLGTGNASTSLLHASATVSPDGAFVFAIGGDVLYKIETASGKLEWATTLPVTNADSSSSSSSSSSFSSPACSADGSAVFVGLDQARSGQLYKIAAADGRSLWHAPLSFKIGSSSPAISTDEGVVYINGNDHRMHAYTTNDGTERWASSLLPSDQATITDGGQYNSYSTPAVSRDGKFLYVGGEDGRLHAMFASDGTEMWVYPPRAATISGKTTMRSSPAIVITMALFLSDHRTGKCTPWTRHRERKSGRFMCLTDRQW